MFRNLTRLSNPASAKRTFSQCSASLQNSTPTKTVVSSRKAGTPLNLKIKKTGNEPVALEDSEYPAWLWSVLEEKVPETIPSNISKEEQFALRKKQLRSANRQKIKSNNFLGNS
ncbi:hypothetical protein ACO0RG_004561 [Hanseniaspora osmophila]